MRGLTGLVSGGLFRRKSPGFVVSPLLTTTYGFFPLLEAVNPSGLAASYLQKGKRAMKTLLAFVCLTAGVRAAEPYNLILDNLNLPPRPEEKVIADVPPTGVVITDIVAYHTASNVCQLRERNENGTFNRITFVSGQDPNHHIHFTSGIIFRDK